MNKRNFLSSALACLALLAPPVLAEKRPMYQDFPDALAQDIEYILTEVWPYTQLKSCSLEPFRVVVIAKPSRQEALISKIRYYGVSDRIDAYSPGISANKIRGVANLFVLIDKDLSLPTELKIALNNSVKTAKQCSNTVSSLVLIL